jgi:hypothetical protein
MTVLSGGISDGHLWDMVEVEVMEGLQIRTLRPMMPMTAGDLGDVQQEAIDVDSETLGLAPGDAADPVVAAGSEDPA